MRFGKLRHWAMMMLFSMGSALPVWANEQAVDLNPIYEVTDGHKSIGGAAGKLVDLILSETGVMHALTASGVRGMEASLVRNSVSSSLQALNMGRGLPNRRQLAGLIRNLPNIPEKNRLRRLLNMQESDLTKNEFVETVNLLIYVANRYGAGQSTVLACAPCVSDNLAKHGFRFTMQAITNPVALKALDGVVPVDPGDLNTFIQRKMSDLGFGNFDSRAARIVTDAEKRSFALFLAIAESGSAAQKEVVDAIKRVSTDSQGVMKLLNPDNKHKLWKLFLDDLNDEELRGWAKILNEVADDANAKKQVSKNEAFYAYFDRHAGNDPKRIRAKEVINTRKCYFD